tara:strand:+ start:584 stop:1147 length:564 start_codon:yes stop_codon:yes gene_type:complete
MSVKEEHYKVVYETGGVIKPTNKDPQEADPSKEKLTPGAHFQEGGEVDDKEKFSEKVRAKADEPNFQEKLEMETPNQAVDFGEIVKPYLGKPLTMATLTAIIKQFMPPSQEPARIKESDVKLKDPARIKESDVKLKEDKEIEKKRLGGSVGYSYKNQKYQKPTGDNYASSNRAAQGESFDDITGMGE